MGFLDFFNPPELKPNEKYRGYEQPNWKLLPDQPKDGSFEIRSYPAAHWTSTVSPSMTQGKMDRESFWKLFGYITGKNEKNEKISMTVPVTMKMLRNEKPNSTSGYTMSFYTPSDHQDRPPAPSNPDVFIENRKDIVVYVRVFRGFAKRPEFSEQAKALYDDLAKNGIDNSKIDSESFYGVGYDSPFRLFNRRNEVWFIASDQESSDHGGLHQGASDQEAPSSTDQS